MSDLHNTDSWSVKKSNEFYKMDNWSDGYFAINNQGNVEVKPYGQNSTQSIDAFEVIEEIKDHKVGFPLVLRFHDILQTRVININKMFNEYIDQYEFQGKYMGVYPIKVNQLREVVEEVMKAGAPFNFGIEAGSKSELLAALAMNTNPKSLTILNGYKDKEYLKLALLGRKLGRKVIVVIEKFSELPLLIETAKEMSVKPMIGIRTKLNCEGSGKWACSTGERAKFGLTIPEVLKAYHYLKDEGYLDCLKLTHFHIGSQIPDIRTIKDAITEGARVYAKLVALGAPIKYFDVGGGVGVDYDGTKSNSHSSINYSFSDYVSDVVYILKEICDVEGVHHPHIVSESGRALTAHHSCVVTKVFGKIDKYTAKEFPKTKNENILVKTLRIILEDLNDANYREAYYDCMLKKEEINSAFKLGILDLEERANSELMINQILKQISRIVVKMDDKSSIPEEIQNLTNTQSSQFLCNFSVFQSIPDAWAINQIVPVVPMHKHQQKPTKACTLADITCDSDGKVDLFNVDCGESSKLMLHNLDENDYYIGFFLTGAYQDIMGDMHNLFGRLNEVHVFNDPDDPKGFYIEETMKGQSSSDVLKIMQYNPEMLAFIMKNEIDIKIKQGEIRPREGVELVNFYEDCLENYTYLDV